MGIPMHVIYEGLYSGKRLISEMTGPFVNMVGYKQGGVLIIGGLLGLQYLSNRPIYIYTYSG
jgi:hypothetical protein